MAAQPVIFMVPMQNEMCIRDRAKVENYKELGLNSETAAMFNITTREQVIVNTWYGGEMKKGMFSMMNYFLPVSYTHLAYAPDRSGESSALCCG